MGFKPPKATLEAVTNVGVVKGHARIDYLLVQGFFAGAYIAFGGLLALIVGGAMDGIKGTEAGDLDSIGIQKFVFGAVFPVGLMAVIFTGAELFTGNCMCLIPPFLDRNIKWYHVLKNWVFSYTGNLIGSLFVAFFLSYLTNFFATGTQWNATIVAEASGKNAASWYQPFFKGIGCNWLVCLAVWQAVAANDVASKVWGIWWPIMAFVAIGFEHSIANCFFVPLGVMVGLDWFEFFRFFYANLLPVTIGNIIGGSFFMGVMYWYLFSDNKPYEFRWKTETDKQEV